MSYSLSHYYNMKRKREDNKKKGLCRCGRKLAINKKSCKQCLRLAIKRTKKWQKNKFKLNKR